MGRYARIYFHMILGGIGGLLGWMIFGELVARDWPWWAAALLGGAIIGGFIGYCIVAVDALLDRAWLRFCRFAHYGIILGSAGGAFGFWIGDWANYLLVPDRTGGASLGMILGAALARGLGWMFLGLAIGLSQGVAARSKRKLVYGTTGGVIGGFIGGVIFALLMESLGKSEASYIWGQALGLIILGACIGFFIAFVEEVFKPAALKVIRGWQEGREYALVKNSNLLGRDESADVLLLRDIQIAKRHAIIEQTGKKYRLVNLTNPAPTINGQPVNDKCDLQNGDRIQLGDMVILFIQRD